MLTFLSSPKPFTGVMDRIQRKAILSWRSVHPDAEVIIYGEGEGVAEACRELNVRHVPEIPCAPSGIPYFNGIVEHARAQARHSVQCYLNCDILVPREIIAVIAAITFTEYLVVGQRIDLAEGVDIEASGNWKSELRHLAAKGNARLHESSGMDYFIFPRGLWEGLPPLIIGRGGYDGALLAFCLRNRIPMINASLALPVLHQFHDYGHVEGGVHTVHRGADAEANVTLHNIRHSMPNSADAQWMILDGKVVENAVQSDRLRRMELAIRFDRKLEFPSLAVRFLWRLAVATKLYRVRTLHLEDIIGPFSVALAACGASGGLPWS